MSTELTTYDYHITNIIYDITWHRRWCMQK